MNKEPRYHIFGMHAHDLWENKNILVEDIMPGHNCTHQIPEKNHSNNKMILNYEEIKELKDIVEIYLSVRQEIDGGDWELNVTPLLRKLILWNVWNYEMV